MQYSFKISNENEYRILIVDYSAYQQSNYNDDTLFDF